MTARSRPHPALPLAALLLAAVTLLEPLVGRPPQPPATRQDSTAGFFELPERERVAAAARREDFETIRAALGPSTAKGSRRREEARVLLGLYAHACDRPEQARELLLSVGDYSGPLADWRLLALAESAAAVGNAPAAQAAFVGLLADTRSPLRRRALKRAAQVAYERGDHERALSLIERAREEGFEPEHLVELERLAWRIGGELGSRHLQMDAARRLLTDYPAVAAELDVLELLGRTGDAIEIADLLDFDQLLRRARRLLDLNLDREALATLETVPGDGRELAWRFLFAEALTENHRGLEALELLDRMTPPTAAEKTRVEWLRAMAALDVARARRDRQDLPPAARETMAQRARGHLWRLVGPGIDHDLKLAALRTLFSEAAAAEDHPASLRALQRLLALDPGDTTGSAYLFRLGWKEFATGRPAAAIGFWNDLIDLYPHSGHSRAGLYWTARAHGLLGEEDRASEIFRSVAAVGVSDFYSRHALARLQATASTTATRFDAPVEPWPRDRRLDRAGWLSEWGLDEAALIELEALSESVDARAEHALRARILGRLGRRRQSIQNLLRAFPELGTPSQTRVPPDALTLYYPLDFLDTIERYSEAHGLPTHLVQGMIRQESAFDPAARSWAGARGLMQLMPATGRELARRLRVPYSSSRLDDPELSVRLGTAYFRQMLVMFDRREELALAGYNAGPYRIKRLWQRAERRTELDAFLEGLHLPETRNYVKRVLLFADSYRRLYGRGA